MMTTTLTQPSTIPVHAAQRPLMAPSVASMWRGAFRPTQMAGTEHAQRLVVRDNGPAPQDDLQASLLLDLGWVSYWVP
jgi:hypothetical protein